MSLTLRSARLVLRQVTAETAAEFTDLLIQLDSDPQVMRYLTGRPTPPAEIREKLVPLLVQQAREQPEFGRFIAFAEERCVGRVSLRPGVPADRADAKPSAGEAEIGWRLLPSEWGKGYATEGALALLQHGFDTVGLHRVFAQTMGANTASIRVMDRVGLRYLRTFHPRFDHPLPGAEAGDVEYEAWQSTWATQHADVAEIVPVEHLHRRDVDEHPVRGRFQ